MLLSNIGLGFLFLLAGYELDPRLLRQRPGRLARTGWAVTAVLAVGVVAGLAGGAVGELLPTIAISVFLTGIVLRAWTRQMNMDTTGLEHKFDAVGYGIFIPTHCG